jgi:hypothetical protein
LLRAVEEPRDLLGRLRRSLADSPGETRGEAVRLVAQRLKSKWAPALEPYGVRPAMLRSWVAGGDRELWLWVVGDRTWIQVVDGLAGRVARRATRAGRD